MNEDELRRILNDVLREGVNGVTPLTGPAFGTTFHIYPVPGGDEIDVRVRIKQKHLPRLLSWRKGDVDVSLDENREWADITVPLSDLPSFLSGLSGLTLEDVEKAVEDTRQTINDKRNGWSASARAAGEQALEMFLRRLRQQVNVHERRARRDCRAGAEGVGGYEGHAG